MMLYMTDKAKKDIEGVCSAIYADGSEEWKQLQMMLMAIVEAEVRRQLNVEPLTRRNVDQ